MGKIACNYSDQVIITSDNPRTEDPQKIIDEIKTGLTGHSYEILVDRTEAIQRAVQSANDHDIILIAGKGHETYQILGSQKIEFDDRKVALAALKQRKLDR
jgi:UDP-N-acetylmuramoyl-L-alanyl-D-glutamate--2,6-diaminopimelate ligase